MFINVLPGGNFFCGQNIVVNYIKSIVSTSSPLSLFQQKRALTSWIMIMNGLLVKV